MPDPTPQSTTKCPFCLSEIHPDARKCKFCGEWVDPTQNAAPTPPLPPKQESELISCPSCWAKYESWASACPTCYAVNPSKSLTEADFAEPTEPEPLSGGPLGLAITSMILGGLALPIALVPGCGVGCMTIIPGALGLLLGITGVILAKARNQRASLCVAAVVVCTVTCTLFFAQGALLGMGHR